jgi:hypothetical protein
MCNGFVIKDKKTGQYYRGCPGGSVKTLRAAKIYISKKAAENVAKKSTNFNFTEYEIIEVIIKEANNDL